MSKKQIRLADLAEILGISTATVSRALKDYPDISAETKKRVIALAKELNYRPNTLAAGLRKSETRIIGVIIPEIADHFFSKIIKGIMEVAYREGYNVMLCQSDEDYEKEVKDADALLSSRVDGLMVSIGNHTHDFTHLMEFLHAEVPLVLFDKTTPELENCSRVIVDDYAGAFQAVEHLIQQGCKRIAHIGGSSEAFTFQNRLNGYKAALSKHGLPLHDGLVFQCEQLTLQVAKEHGKILSQISPPIDGVFAATDLMGIGVMNGLKANGIKIPEDVKVMGFSNWEMAEAVDPPMSSVKQPGYEMGKIATEMLIQEIKDQKAEKEIVYEKVVLQTGLAIRASTLPIVSNAGK
jgi:LacI family transcriptional regulator